VNNIPGVGVKSLIRSVFAMPTKINGGILLVEIYKPADIVEVSIAIEYVDGWIVFLR
jgi:hypothetical protein